MKLIFKGIVQGVGFRPTIYRIAQDLDLKGYVINKGSEVEVVVDRKVDEFIEKIYQQLPSLARITDIIKKPDNRHFSDFKILQSTPGFHKSIIPADVAICAACQKEIFSKTDRRYLFPFTNCTICGARYSIITQVPYDRERTAMESFPLCSQCQKEYTEVTNRRYHAQTISCPKCGPKYMLFSTDGNRCKVENVFQRFAQELDNGDFGVIKSWGGMHLCCRIEEISRFRSWYRRLQKPFALMVKNLEIARTYGQVSKLEEDLLQSQTRPIVLLHNKKGEFVSPGLDTIGIFLPYTGLHYILFHYLAADALIMTSANIPGEPMLLENESVFSLKADWYLLHNRAIPNRIDDSVLKVWRNKSMFIRKARGYVPDPLPVPYPKQVLSVGASDNIYGALSANKKLYSTQYIGNGAYYNTLVFLEDSLRHLIQLFMDEPDLDGVGIDRHPGYETNVLGKRFGEEFNVPVIEVLHHWAHAVALLHDSQVDEAVVLTLDGLGFGDDGTFWGGDILAATVSEYKRVGHLEYMPLLGGDKATMDPRRLVFALFPEKAEELGFSDSEASLLEKIRSSSPQCCSMGRYLDALACYLKICCTRTYSGEPAMKLEKYLAQGHPRYQFNINRSGSVVPVFEIFKQVDEQIRRPLSEQHRADVCYSVVKYLIDSLVSVSVAYAQDQGIPFIGITGGVSYNLPIMDMVANAVDEAGLQILVHKKVPNGDGCIAIGQNIIVGHYLASD